MKINLTLKLNPLVMIVVKMQVGIVLDRGLGGLAKTSKLTLKHKNKVKNVRKDSQDSKQVQKTQNGLKTLKTA